MSVVTTKLPPVPNAVPIYGNPTGIISQQWQQWFIQLKAKVDTINTSLVNIAGTSGPGVLATDGNGNWYVRTLTAGSNVTITNGTGATGDPVIAASGGGGGGTLSITSVTTSAYTLVAGDSMAFVDINYTAACTVTIPTNASVALPVGTLIRLGSRNNHNLFISQSSGVSSIDHTYTAATPPLGYIFQVAANLWHVYGNFTVLSNYQNTILADGPAAYWPLNDPSGSVAKDLSSNGNTATYINSPTLGTNSITANTGFGATLNGTNQYIELASPPAVLQLAQGSFEFWIDFSSVGSGVGILDTAYSSSPVNFAIQLGTALGTTSGTNWCSGNYTGSAWQGYVGTAGPTAATAYHVVYTYNGTTASLYINGTLLGSTTASTTITPTSNAIYIGRRWDTSGTSNYVTGTISNVAIYSSILTSTQILNHYNAGK